VSVIDRYSHPAVAEWPRRFNVAPGQAAPITLPGEPPRLARWELLAPWRGHGGVRPPPIRTAQLTEIARTPVLARARRCLVAGDGWYAKAKLGKAIHAWWIHGATAFAGLTTTHKEDGIEAFAIVMVPAPAALRAYSELLPAGGGVAWLAGGDPDEIAWRAVEISRHFEDIAHDDERCIAPVGNPNQGSLF
jgi:putative SOS response-associated peptidase YedK